MATIDLYRQHRKRVDSAEAILKAERIIQESLLLAEKENQRQNKLKDRTAGILLRMDVLQDEISRLKSIWGVGQ